jgi:hypothetical protein
VGVIDAPLPQGVTAESIEGQAYKAQWQAAQSSGAAGVLRPANYPEPNILNLGKSDSSIFELALRTPVTNMIVAWLGQDGTATNEGGSLAKAQVLSGVAYDLVERRARTCWGALGPNGTRERGTVTEQILRPWVLFQEGGTSEICPLVRRIVPDLEESQRLAEDQKRAMSFYAELAQIRASGFEVTEQVVFDLAALRGVRLPTMRWAAPAPVSEQPGDPQ